MIIKKHKCFEISEHNEITKKFFYYHDNEKLDLSFRVRSTNYIAFLATATLVSTMLLAGLPVQRHPIEPDQYILQTDKINNITFRDLLHNKDFVFLATVAFPFVSANTLQTYTSAASWNNSDNTVQVIGAGGGGAKGASTSTGGGGGAGGGYNKITNFTFATPGTTTAQYQVGGCAAWGGAFPHNGGDTWFNAAAFPVGGTAVGAKGGISPASNTTATGATATATSSFFPTTSPPARAGGNGAAGTSATAGGGGGGAGGPSGAGGNASTTTGGTSDGGTVTGGSPGNPGTNNSGTEFDATHGCGSGGGASNASGGTGGAGGAYGGGAGGGSRSNGIGGKGGDGLLALTWTVITTDIGAITGTGFGPPYF